ncbi:hypothetical protein ACFY9N_17135 [Microbacterium sp. NPDC008134]|uniref:hypothetical protein n=1 Tax=Microbacterium sp. NPDC008134 TaxID=3364183 RepID=UPI0036E3D90B
MFAFAASELGTSLLWLSVGLLTIAAVSAVVVLVGRRRGSRTLALDVALTLSSWWTILSAIGLVFVLIKAFTADFAEVAGAPMNVAWSENLPCRTGELTSGDAGPLLWCASASASDITISQPSVDVRALSAAAQAVAVLYSTIPAVLIAVICFQTLRGRPFTRTITRTLIGGAIVAVVLGIANDVLPGIAATVALRSVLPIDHDLYPHTFQITVTPFPVVAALALIALAAVFRQGMRLQRENAALQKETEGLV